MLKTILAVSLAALPAVAQDQDQAPPSDQPQVQVIIPPQAQPQLLPPDARGKLGKIASFLQSISDNDYLGAIAQVLPNKGRRPGVFATRTGALQVTYDTMAGLELDRAKQLSPDKAQTAPRPTETGWGIDLLKLLGNAAAIYYLHTPIFVGRQLRTPEQRKLDKTIDQLNAQLESSDLAPDKEAGLRAQLAQAYQDRAKTVAPESDDEKAAKKEAKVKQLADLLKSVSDDDYEDAAKQAGLQDKNTELASRPAALKTAYTTLAGFEYRRASRQAPKDEAYSKDYQRVAADDAKNLAVDPDTLQETGWFTDLLGIAALGGAGYAIYEETQEGHHHGGGPGSGPGGPAQALSAFSPAVVVSGVATSATSSIGRSMARDSAGNLYLAYMKPYRGSPRIFVARSKDGGATWADTTSVPVDASGCPQVSYPLLAVDGRDTLWLAAISNVPPKCTYGRMGAISASAPGTQWSAWQFIRGAYPYIGYETARALAAAGDGSLHLLWSGQDAFAPSGYSYGYVVRYASLTPAGRVWSAYSLLPGGDGSKNAGLNDPNLAIGPDSTLHVVSRQHGSSYDAPGKLVYSSKPAAGGSWSAPVGIEGTGLNQENASLALDGAGTLHLLWDAQDAGSGGAYRIKYAMKRPEAGWSALTNVLPDSASAQLNPSLTVEASGTLDASWTERGGMTPGLAFARGSGGSWIPVAAPSGARAAVPGTAALRWAGFDQHQGDVGAAWTQPDGVRFARAQSLPLGPGFGASVARPIATGRTVAANASPDAIDERLASDDYNLRDAARLHHELGAAYEKLALAEAPVPEPQAEPAESAEQPRPPSEDEQREQDIKDLDQTGKKMERQIDQRRQGQ